MSQIIGINTAHEIWIALEQNFLVTSMARIMQLRLQLQTAKKRWTINVGIFAQNQEGC